MTRKVGYSTARKVGYCNARSVDIQMHGSMVKQSLKYEIRKLRHHSASASCGFRMNQLPIVALLIIVIHSCFA